MFGSDPSVECPSCRASSYGEKHKIAVSITLKKTISVYKNNKEKLKKDLPFDVDRHKTIEVDDTKVDCKQKSMGVCDEHKKPAQFGCTTCNMWLCGKCVCLSHSGEDKNCEVFKISEAIIRQSLSIIKIMNERKQECKTLRAKNKNVLQTSNKLREGFKYMKEQIGDKMKELKKIQKRYKKQQKRISENQPKIREVMTNIEAASDPINEIAAIRKHHTCESLYPLRNASYFRWREWSEHVSSLTYWLITL